MTVEAARAFLEYIDKSTDIQDEISKQISHGLEINWIELGRQYGFDFSEAEADEVCAQTTGPDELSDSDLEAVAGGHGSHLSPEDIRRIATQHVRRMITKRNIFTFRNLP